MADDRMLWIDIETTGLEPTEDVILELGLAITDKFGGLLDQESWLVGSKLPYYDKAVKRGREHEIVGPMHEMNDLWQEWEFAVNSDLDTRNSMLPRAVEQEAISFLQKNDVQPGTLEMCGASVGSLDRPMLKEHMPNLLEYFHYRIIDISTLRGLADRHNPHIGRAGDHVQFESSDVPHRVLYDINYSIFEYKHYLENFLFVAED
jgi:oligoribonuclease